MILTSRWIGGWLQILFLSVCKKMLMHSPHDMHASSERLNELIYGVKLSIFMC